MRSPGKPEIWSPPVVSHLTVVWDTSGPNHTGRFINVDYKYHPVRSLGLDKSSNSHHQRKNFPQPNTVICHNAYILAGISKEYSRLRCVNQSKIVVVFQWLKNGCWIKGKMLFHDHNLYYPTISSTLDSSFRWMKNPSKHLDVASSVHGFISCIFVLIRSGTE